MIERGANAPMKPCYICGDPQPQGRYHEFPWHITCAYDEAGKRKIAAWKREQKKLKEAELPTLV